MKIKEMAMAAGLSAVFAVSSVLPAQALPVTSAPPQVERQASPNIVQVNHTWRHGKRWHGKRWHGGRRHYGHRHWHGRHYSHRRHWRGGVWIGGPRIVIGARTGNRWKRHVRWCRNNYVSYRRSDNSFMTYSGVRRACVSPYRR